MANNVSDILTLESKKIESLGASMKENYLHHPPSNAVDMKPDTIFRSLARKCWAVLLPDFRILNGPTTESRRGEGRLPDNRRSHRYQRSPRMDCN